MPRYQASPSRCGFVVRDTYADVTVSRPYRTMGWATRRADQLNEEAFQHALTRVVYGPPPVEGD